MRVVSDLENPCCIVKGLSFDLLKEKNTSSKGITEKKVCRMGCFCERDAYATLDGDRCHHRDARGLHSLRKPMLHCERVEF